MLPAQQIKRIIASWLTENLSGSNGPCVIVLALYPKHLHITMQIRLYLHLLEVPGARGGVILSSPSSRCSFHNPFRCYGLDQDCLISESSPEFTQLSMQSHRCIRFHLNHVP